MAIAILRQSYSKFLLNYFLAIKTLATKNINTRSRWLHQRLLVCFFASVARLYAFFVLYDEKIFTSKIDPVFHQRGKFSKLLSDNFLSVSYG